MKKNYLLLSGLFVLFFFSCNSSQGNVKNQTDGYIPLNTSAKASVDSYTAYRETGNLPERAELFFFYEQSCEICNDLTEFYALILEKITQEDRKLFPYIIYTINTFDAEGRKTYERVTNAAGFDRTLLQVPLLLGGGRVFQGMSSISDNLEEAFLTAGEDIFTYHRFYIPALRKTGGNLFADYSINPNHTTFVYFYRTVCPYCAKVAPLINGLPGTVEVDGNQIPLDIIKINTRSGNNNERINAFFDLYQVPDADRKVPIIFLANGYLAGVDPISANLTEKLSSGPGENRLQEIINGK
jgi:thiol-disulfide isomerase/thioredoxin